MDEGDADLSFFFLPSMKLKASSTVYLNTIPTSLPATYIPNMSIGQFPFTLGTDIVLHSRFVRPHNAWLKKLSIRVLTPTEIEQTKERFPDWYGFLTSHNEDSKVDYDTAPKECRSYTTWLAGRWASKEAARKAWGASIIGFRDVEVRYVNRRPYIFCSPWEHQTFIKNPETSELEQFGMLSVSHDGDYATATVIAEPLRKELHDVFSERATSVTEAIEKAKIETGISDPRRLKFNDPNALIVRAPAVPKHHQQEPSDPNVAETK